MTTLYDFEVTDIDGQKRALSAYRGKPVVIANVASRCGLTPQYAGLQALHEEYADKGVAVLGFPCNQFGAQEPGTEADIKAFCSTQYAVTFPMFSKVEVNGSGAHPLYKWLTAEATEPDGPGDIKWNFAKFVIGPDGAVAGRFSPQTEPSELKSTLDRLL